MDKFPGPITKQCIRKIMEQINYPIYKLDEKNSKFICFFCHIKYKNENIPVLITTYQIINEEYLVNNNSIDILTLLARKGRGSLHFNYQYFGAGVQHKWS